MKNIKHIKVPDGAYSLIYLESDSEMLTLSENLAFEPAKYYTPDNRSSGMWVPTWQFTYDAATRDDFIDSIFDKDGHYLVTYRDDYFPSTDHYKKDNLMFACFGVAYCPDAFFFSTGRNR